MVRAAHKKWGLKVLNCLITARKVTCWQKIKPASPPLSNALPGNRKDGNLGLRIKENFLNPHPFDSSKAPFYIERFITSRKKKNDGIVYMHTLKETSIFLF